MLFAILLVGIPKAQDTIGLHARNPGLMQYSDTTTFTNRVNGVQATAVKYTDTAAMLLAYIRSILSVKYSDTSNMLAVYLRKQDTSAMLSVYMRKSIPVMVTRTIGTAFQPSTTRMVEGKYTVQIACTISLTTGQSGTIVLQTSPDNITYTTVGTFTNTNTGTLTIGLALTTTNAMQLSAFIPAGYYAKLVSSGTGTFSYIGGTEQVF